MQIRAITKVIKHKMIKVFAFIYVAKGMRLLICTNSKYRLSSRKPLKLKEINAAIRRAHAEAHISKTIA